MTGIKRTGTAFLCVFLSVLLLTGALICGAEEVQEKGAVTVTDDAQVLMEEEADWLKSIAEALSEKSGWSVVVATCSDAGGKKAQTVCEENFNRYTAGDDGISCLVDLDNRELYLATAGDALLYLNDSRLDQILEDAHAAAEKEDYAQALYLMLTESEQNYLKGIPEGAKTKGEMSGIASAAGGLAVMILVAGGGLLLGRIVRRRPSARQTGYRRNYRRPPNASAKSSRPANRSTVRTGAGGRKFGGRGRKF